MSQVENKNIEDILALMKKNSRRNDLKLIRKAYNFAKEHHGDQLRKSGEPYIIHPIQVAYILADLGLDDSTICAALLHDIVEDTDVTKQSLAEEFGTEIAELVDGVTKLSKLQYASMEEQQVENYRKMFLAMGKDIRVILIKLADRLHNMRTLKFLSRDRQIANANETMELYAPLANRLGVYSLKWELEDLSFKYLYPEEYRELVEGIDKKREERLEFIDKIMDEIRVELKKQRIVAEITGRAKHLYSIYRKMKRDNITLDQVYDLFALRIIVNSVKDCYAALGVVHDLYNPMPGRFKDYISVPKPNMYQSLHTTLIGPKGTPFEVQIRTWDMHRIAEYGIAAHWAYKEASFKGNKKANVKVEEDKLSWLRETLEWQKEMQDPDEFLNTLKRELFEDMQWPENMDICEDLYSNAWIVSKHPDLKVTILPESYYQYYMYESSATHNIEKLISPSGEWKYFTAHRLIEELFIGDPQITRMLKISEAVLIQYGIQMLSGGHDFSETKRALKRASLKFLFIMLKSEKSIREKIKWIYDCFL